MALAGGIAGSAAAAPHGTHRGGRGAVANLGRLVEDAPFARDEWDVELADGTLCRLAREGRAWRLEAIYD